MPLKRNQNHSENSTTVNAMVNCVLPQDVMFAILARLPAKSLCGFKSVCKQWCGLVTNPNFIKLHSHHFPQTPKTLSVQSHLLNCSILSIDPPAVDPHTPYDETFLDCCNGLVCIGRPLFTEEVVLWNPATNLWKFLPHSMANFGTVEMVSLGFGCNSDGDDFGGF